MQLERGAHVSAHGHRREGATRWEPARSASATSRLRRCWMRRSRRRPCARSSRAFRSRPGRRTRSSWKRNGDLLPLSISMLRRADRRQDGAGRLRASARRTGRACRTGRLPDALAEAGVKPEEIDIVIATHIHIDHVGWHTTARGGGFVPTFPKATHVFNRDEWAYWTAPDVATGDAVGDRLRAAAGGRRGDLAGRRRAQGHGRADAAPDAGSHAGAHLRGDRVGAARPA